MESLVNPLPRKKVLRAIASRTLKRETLGLEAYLWVAHRITGLILLLFLLFHLYTLSSIFSGEGAYNRVLESLDRPVMKIGEILLLWVVLFHILNGARLILFNLFPSIDHKRLGYVAAIASLVLAFVSVPFIVGT